MKQWYLSKTVWVNLLALLGISLEAVTGKQVLDADIQAEILTVINLILRLVTKQGITFKDVINVIKPDATPVTQEPAKMTPNAVDVVLPAATDQKQNTAQQ